MKIKVNKHDIAFGTNVLDINIPDILTKKFKTGIEHVDGCLGGQGFTPSTVTLFTGEPGAGKTTMVLDIADAITKKKGIALFNTAEESLFQTAMTAKRIGLKHGFLTGNSNQISEIIGNARKIMKQNPGKQFFLIVDSLQCMDDGHYHDGRITSQTAVRCLTKITEFCKETNACAVVINQVNKSGKMSGSNKLKHMVDCHIHLSIERKDDELLGCRILESEKNRFGGCGHVFFLNLGRKGFKVVARVSAC